MYAQPRYSMTKKRSAKKSSVEKVSMNLTKLIGTPYSVIGHSVFFVLIFGLRFFGVGVQDILLILTTVVSLEAIYLSIFIQMTINYNTESLKEVEKDVDEIAKDVDEIQSDVDEIQTDVDEIQEDVEGLEEDIDKIQAEEEKEDLTITGEVMQTKELIGKMENQLQRIMDELQVLKGKS